MLIRFASIGWEKRRECSAVPVQYRVEFDYPRLTKLNVQRGNIKIHILRNFATCPRLSIVRFTVMKSSSKPAPRKVRLLPLIAATYFMVSGGPYGLEDILGGAGFGRAILILIVLPIIWSLPTALMIGELASALPAEGGFYVWVRRALGPFWGFQEGWLSLSASIFDMALYPTIFVLYLGKFSPALTAGGYGYGWSSRLSRYLFFGTCAARPLSAKVPSAFSFFCLCRLRSSWCWDCGVASSSIHM